MGRLVETTYNGAKEILRFPTHSIQISVMVDQAGVTADSNGRKIVKAGTIVGGKGGSVLSDDTLTVEAKNTESTGTNAEGVLLYDVDVTNGSMEGAMIIHGFVNLGNLPAEPCASAKTALKQITFLK